LCAHADNLDERQFGCLVEADSSIEVVYDGIVGCFAARSTSADRVQTVVKLLEMNPAAARHKDMEPRDWNLAHYASYASYHSDRIAATDCIEILKLVLARNKDALKEADDDGKLPAHVAAEWGPVEVLDFVLGEYPEAVTAVDSESRNLLHIAAGYGPDEHGAARARLLCVRYPAMMLQRNRDGRTPLVDSCLQGHAAIALLLCEAGGREAASTAIMHPTNVQDSRNGWLPLHILIDLNATTLKTEPLSALADAFRLLLRLYPEAAGIKGGAGSDKKTPYRLAVDKGLPTYYRRLLLRAVPNLNLAELRRLHWAERRLAIFIAFAAVPKQATAPPLLARLRATDKQLVKHVVSFL